METQTKEISQEVLNHINSNPIIYGLMFRDYVDGKIVYSDPSESAIRDAFRNLELFYQRQEAINSRTNITDGDWIIRKNGNYERITISSGGWVQAGGSAGSSVYISKNGYGSYSGSCGDSIDSYELTYEVKEGICWLFSGDRAGAHRGVYSRLNFKVYREL